MAFSPRQGPGVRVRDSTTKELILRCSREGEGTLNLSNRTISPEDAQLLSENLASSSSSFHTITLYNVKMSVEGALILAKGLEFNETLTCLLFDHTSIGEVGIGAVVEAVKFSTSLKRLSLASTVTNSNAAALVANALSTNQSLTSISLESNRALGTQGAEKLAKSFSVHETLTNINLSGCGLGDEGIAHVANALASNTVLLELDLSSNGATNSAACYLADTIANENTTLKSLILSRAALPLSALREDSSINLSGLPLSADLDYPVVMRILKKNESLRKLCIAQAGLCGVLEYGRGKRTLTGVNELKGLLQSRKLNEGVDLVFLDISNNGIQDEEAIVVSEGISSLPGLVHLYLSGNSFGVKGLSAILGVLPPILEELCLTGNRSIGCMGGKELGDSLSRGMKIKVLKVEGCGIGDDGTIALSNGISKCTTLEELYIEGNDIGNDGKEYLGNILLSAPLGCHSLKVFSCDLWRMKPGERCIDFEASSLPNSSDVHLLCGVIRNNTWLRFLVLDGIQIGNRGLSSLINFLYETTTITSVSLKGCGIDAKSGNRLLELVGNKPGLCLHCPDNPLIYKDVILELSTAEDRVSTILDNSSEVVRGVSVHLIGPSGSGKTTLSLSLCRSYWESYTQWGLERVDDRGAGAPELTTSGFTADSVTINNEHFWLWDYGGCKAPQALMGVAGLLNHPYSIFICCVSLIEKKEVQREQLRSSLRLIQTCSRGDPFGLQARAVFIIGSRTDQMGKVGAEYLEKLYSSVIEDLAKEQSSVGLDPSLPPCICVLDVDCRKSSCTSIQKLRLELCKTKAALIESGLVQCPKLYQYVEQKVSAWRDEGVQAIDWPEFLKRLRRDFYPRLPETTAQAIAHGLSVAAGIRLVSRCAGSVVRWVLLDPQKILGTFLGGIYFENKQQLSEDEIQLRLNTCDIKLSLGNIIAILRDMGLAVRACCGDTDDIELNQAAATLFGLPGPKAAAFIKKSAHRSLLLHNVFNISSELKITAEIAKPEETNSMDVIIFPGIWENIRKGPLLSFSPMHALEAPGYEVFVARRIVCKSTAVVPGIFARLQSGLLQRYGDSGMLTFGLCGLTAILKCFRVWVHNWDSCIFQGSTDMIRGIPYPDDTGSNNKSLGNENFHPAPWFDLGIVADSFEFAKVELSEIMSMAEEAFSLYPGLYPEIFVLSSSLLSFHHKCGDVSAVGLETASSMAVPLKSIEELQQEQKDELSWDFTFPDGSTDKLSDLLLIENGIAVDKSSTLESKNPFAVPFFQALHIEVPRTMQNPFSTIKEPQQEKECPPLDMKHIQNRSLRDLNKLGLETFDTDDYVYQEFRHESAKHLSDSSMPISEFMFAPSLSGAPISLQDNSFEIVVGAPGGLLLEPLISELFLSTRSLDASEGEDEYEMAVVKEVLDPIIMSMFDEKGERLSIVGFLVKGVSNKPLGYESNDPERPFMTWKEVNDALEGPKAKFPIFVQLLRSTTPIAPTTSSVKSFLVVKNEESGGFHFSGYLPDLRKGDTEGPDMICWGIATVCSGVEGNPLIESSWLINKVMSNYDRAFTLAEHNMHATIRQFVHVAIALRASTKRFIWHANSMGCYLILNMVERLNFMGEDITSIFRVAVEVACKKDIPVAHYYNPQDQAIDFSMKRRGAEPPVPGHSSVMANPLLEPISCDGCQGQPLNHSYGSKDGRCLWDIREFIAGEPPEKRLLEQQEDGGWKIKA